ncbi:MAG: PD-(D/E)XK nuclease family transposase [Armatimonadetes bacterium]|nr:PD-(D/E)XK nuclease family transposase [Armatimonadota bacterium]
MKGLSLLNDIIFKIVFGTDVSRPVLRALLNALLGLSGERRIVDLDILNPYLDKEHLLDKGVILDVKARDAQGRLYNIEVQVSAQPAYMERAVYYLARLFSEQLEKGDPYTRIAKTIGISLLDFVLFSDLEDLHSTYRFYDTDHQRELTDILELHFIELAKFRRDKPHELRTPFEKWLHVLKFGELYESGLAPVPEALRQEEGIEMALESMRKACASDEVREMIELRMKAMRDEATRMEAAVQQGLEQGLEQGLQQGLQQGLEQGRREGRRALVETARRMRDAGMSIETILSMTGLRPEELNL